jgi:FkbM family methyltransferase
MAINRKQWLRYTGATAAGASLGVFVRGLLDPDRAEERSRRAIPDKVIHPAPPGPAPPSAPEIVGNESFSQCGEDLVVAFMAYSLGIPKVTYLDVGANDPVALSNTYYFYKKGHRGVLVEPNRELCKELRLKRPGDTTLEAGIGFAAAKEADYYVMTYDGLNTFSKEEADHQVEVSKGKIAIQEVLKMPLLNINDVMDEHFHGAPAFLSIDTEGLDLAILKSLDFRRFRPPIICAETLISATRKVRHEIPEFMATQGYVARGGSFVNTIFVDSKLI